MNLRFQSRTHQLTVSLSLSRTVTHCHSLSLTVTHCHSLTNSLTHSLKHDVRPSVRPSVRSAFLPSFLPSFLPFFLPSFTLPLPFSTFAARHFCTLTHSHSLHFIHSLPSFLSFLPSFLRSLTRSLARSLVRSFVRSFVRTEVTAYSSSRPSFARTHAHTPTRTIVPDGFAARVCCCAQCSGGVGRRCVVGRLASSLPLFCQCLPAFSLSSLASLLSTSFVCSAARRDQRIQIRARLWGTNKLALPPQRRQSSPPNYAMETRKMSQKQYLASR